jgi:hypothetical protein
MEAGKQREHASLLQVLSKLMLTYGKRGTRGFQTNNQQEGKSMACSWAR